MKKLVKTTGSFFCKKVILKYHALHTKLISILLVSGHVYLAVGLPSNNFICEGDRGATFYRDILCTMTVNYEANISVFFEILISTKESQL